MRGAFSSASRFQNLNPAQDTSKIVTIHRRCTSELCRRVRSWARNLGERTWTWRLPTGIGGENDRHDDRCGGLDGWLMYGWLVSWSTGNRY